MTDSFKGSDLITLQPNDVNVPYAFVFTVCSATTANDGAIPYGQTVSSATVTAHTEAGVTATSDIILASSHTSYTTTVWLTYPTTLGAGRYHLQIVLYMTATSDSMEFDFKRVVAKNV